MANVKISALPSWTGSAADLRYFVMNNSAETETFKFSGWTSQLIPGNGADSFVTLGVPRTHAPNDYMLVLGNHSGTTASAGANSAVLGGRNNKTTNQFGVVAGGLNNTAGYICGVFGGNGNSADGNTAMIIGGENNTCSNISWGSILNGIQNYMSGGNDVGNQILGGYLNRMSHNGTRGSSIIGGVENRWHHFDSRSVDTRFSYGAILGGTLNRIEGNTNDSSGAHAFPIILGSKQSKIFGEESDDTGTTGATIINSFSSSIKDSYLSAIIEGESSQISGKTRAVMIGTSGRTANADDTTYVENLQVFRQAKYGNYNNGNQGTSYQINWDNGNIQKIVLTANTTFSATNITDGTTYVFKVQQDASGNRIATWTSSQFKFPNSTPPTLSTGANAVDIFTFVAMDGVLYGVAQLNFG